MTREQEQREWGASHACFGVADDCHAPSSSSRSPAYSIYNQDFMDSTSKNFGRASMSMSEELSESQSDISISSSDQVAAMPSPPIFPKWLIEKSKVESKSVLMSGVKSSMVPPPPIPPSFRQNMIISSRLLTDQLSTTLHQPPLPHISIPPPPPPPPPPPLHQHDTLISFETINVMDKESAIDTLMSENICSIAEEIALVKDSSTASTAVATSSGPGQWILVEDEIPVVEVIEVGVWEKHTKGIGGKLLERMGYIRFLFLDPTYIPLSGLGLGKTGQGRLNPIEATSSRGLGQTDDNGENGLRETMKRQKSELETSPVGDSINAFTSDFKEDVGDLLYLNIKTKPHGSGGFKKKKMSSDDNKNKKCNHGNEGNEKKGTVFDFLNKIPSSSGAASSRSSVSVGKTLGSIKISTSSIHAQRKELKKITAKSAF